jgi:hypothetical protein
MDTVYVHDTNNFSEQLLVSQVPTLLAVKPKGGSSSITGEKK